MEGDALKKYTSAKLLSRPPFMTKSPTRDVFVRVIRRMISPTPVLAMILGFACTGEGSRDPVVEAPIARRPNFIVIVVDMLRPDHLGVYGYSKPTSPNLDEWARQGIVFERAYSGAPWTYPSTVSLLTGLFPSEHGADQKEIDQGDLQVVLSTVSSQEAWLPRHFAKAGYQTAAFHSHRYLHRSVSNIHEAFEEFYYTPEEYVGDVDLARDPTPWADEMFLDVLYPSFERWLDQPRSKPFFTYIHLIDVHGPYKELHVLEEDRPAVEKGLRTGDFEFEKMKDTDMYSPRSKGPHKAYLYDGHMAVVDRYLGILRKKLDQLGISEDTYVIVTSDHGEGFGEHSNYWGHGRFVFDTEARVPLIFLSHRAVRNDARRVKRVVSTVGLLPTLADLAGVELERPMSARSFEPILRVGGKAGRQVAIVETLRAGGRQAFLTNFKYKLIHEVKPDTDLMFDLESDPGETSPLQLSELTPVERRYFEELIALRQRYRSVRSAGTRERAPLDDEAVRGLRALGYLQ